MKNGEWKVENGEWRMKKISTLRAINNNSLINWQSITNN